MSNNLLITGGAGFIGANFVYLTAKQHPEDKITVLDKLTYAGNKDSLAPLIKSKKITFIKGDIANKRFVLDLFKKEKFSAVVNFAAETHVDRSIVSPSIFVMTNIIGTHNLLEACRQFGVPRYHQISTDEVYGDLGENSVDYFMENTNLDPNCPYAASKAAADILVLSYFKTYGLFVTISRCSNNYGPYQFPEKLIPYFFHLAENNKPLPLYGKGTNVRDWLFVEDHCSAIDLVLRRGRAGEVYNIGGHNEKQNLEIAHLILKFLGRSPDLITFVEDRLAHDKRYAMDPSKIEKELGWYPSVTFEQGIARTFEWYKANKDWCTKITKKNQIDETRKHISIKEKPTKSIKTNILK
ncbi:MAG: dTDP-glucose 4,6-dehydratase [Candidatus Gracilibacteria bacterium]